MTLCSAGSCSELGMFCLFRRWADVFPPGRPQEGRRCSRRGRGRSPRLVCQRPRPLQRHPGLGKTASKRPGPGESNKNGALHPTFRCPTICATLGCACRWGRIGSYLCGGVGPPRTLHLHEIGPRSPDKRPDPFLGPGAHMNYFSRVLKTMRLRSFDRWTKSSMLGGLEGAGRLGRAFKQLGGERSAPTFSTVSTAARATWGRPNILNRRISAGRETHVFKNKLAYNYTETVSMMATWPKLLGVGSPLISDRAAKTLGVGPQTHPKGRGHCGPLQWWVARRGSAAVDWPVSRGPVKKRNRKTSQQARGRAPNGRQPRAQPLAKHKKNAKHKPNPIKGSHQSHSQPHAPFVEPLHDAVLGRFLF